MATPQERAKKMYGAGGAHDYRHAIESNFSRLEARLAKKGDKEGLAKARAARTEMAEFAGTHAMRADDLHTFLTKVVEYTHDPRGADAVQSRWPRNYEALRETSGGDEGARKALARTESIQSEFKSKVPFIAQMMDGTGLASDPDIINVCSRYGKEAKKD